jgi:hypothetical protein
LGLEQMAASRQTQPAVMVHPGYLKDKLLHAEVTELHFQGVVSSHIRRLKGAESCLDRFRSSVSRLRQQPNLAALAAVDECHNELCILQELLEQQDHPFSLVEYEPPLPNGDQRIDFRATSDVATWFVEVKTIHPELKDRWEQYEHVIQSGQVTDNVTIHFERQWMGGELWHNKFSARAKMLEHALELEDRITAAGLTASRDGFVLALFSDGFAWHEDELEDFVAFYRTGRHRADDGLAKMEAHELHMRGRSLSQLISALAYFCRPPFELVAVEKNWNVKAPPEPW